MTSALESKHVSLIVFINHGNVSCKFNHCHTLIHMFKLDLTSRQFDEKLTLLDCHLDEADVLPPA